mmetsp:Transcript_16420/g.53637  ORF Transcript_16420/g.53637 Transcript_16420/m.53637 type:complete len:309 (+) Transcript_16420:1464-2390(+)
MLPPEPTTLLNCRTAKSCRFSTSSASKYFSEPSFGLSDASIEYATSASSSSLSSSSDSPSASSSASSSARPPTLTAEDELGDNPARSFGRVAGPSSEALRAIDFLRKPPAPLPPPSVAARRALSSRRFSCSALFSASSSILRRSSSRSASRTVSRERCQAPAKVLPAKKESPMLTLSGFPAALPAGAAASSSGTSPPAAFFASLSVLTTRMSELWMSPTSDSKFRQSASIACIRRDKRSLSARSFTSPSCISSSNSASSASWKHSPSSSSSSAMPPAPADTLVWWRANDLRRCGSEATVSTSTAAFWS